MKELLTPKNIFIVILAIYAISAVERMFASDYTQNEIERSYIEEKRQMQTENQLLKDKIHQYEINQLKIDFIVDNATNDQLDSLESVYNP